MTGAVGQDGGGHITGPVGHTGTGGAVGQPSEINEPEKVGHDPEIYCTGAMGHVGTGATGHHAVGRVAGCCEAVGYTTTGGVCGQRRGDLDIRGTFGAVVRSAVGGCSTGGPLGVGTTDRLGVISVGSPDGTCAGCEGTLSEGALAVGATDTAAGTLLAG